MENARRLDELGRIRELIPNENVVFEVIPEMKKKLSNIKLLEEEERVLKNIDGINSIRRIIILSRVNDFKVYQTLYALAMSKVIQKNEKKNYAQKILVIDDSLTIQKMVELSLADQNFEIYTASDGRTGLMKMKQHNPDIILLDVTLPMMNGYEICKEIKEDKNYKDIPVIMLTARDKVIEQLRGKWMGANYYMGKPFSSEELINKINDFIL